MIYGTILVARDNIKVAHRLTQHFVYGMYFNNIKVAQRLTTFCLCDVFQQYQSCHRGGGKICVRTVPMCTVQVYAALHGYLVLRTIYLCKQLIAITFTRRLRAVIVNSYSSLIDFTTIKLILLKSTIVLRGERTLRCEEFIDSRSNTRTTKYFFQ